MRLTLLRRCARFDSARMFDETPEELDRIRRRAELRQKLKTDFNKFNYNPYSSAYGIAYVDPQIERYYAARYYRIEYWKPTFGSFFKFFASIILPYFVIARFFLDRDEENWEKRQSGEITYKNRKIYNFLY